MRRPALACARGSVGGASSDLVVRPGAVRLPVAAVRRHPPGGRPAGPSGGEPGGVPDDTAEPASTGAIAIGRTGQNERGVMERSVRILGGLLLVATGAVLTAGTFGALALDARRLADMWPLTFVVIGIGVLLDAWPPVGARGTRAATRRVEEDEALVRHPDRILGARAGTTEPPTPAPTPSAPTVPSTPAPAPNAPAAPSTLAPAPSVPTMPPSTPAMQRMPPEADVPQRGAPAGGHGTPADVAWPSPAAPDSGIARADLVAALLALQGLRRNGLISKREYRTKRAELVARMTPELLLRELGGTETGPSPGPASQPATGRPHR